MKQLLILLAIVVGSYKAYETLTKPTAFSPDGTAQVLLFTYDKCGKPCREARQYLQERVTFEEVDVRASDANLARFTAMGGRNTMPLVVIGEQTIQGNWPQRMLPALTASYGLSGVSPAQRSALSKNFDAAGDQKLVMYVTQSCGYCKRARQYFQERGLAVREFDIERSPAARRDFAALHGGGTPLIYKGFHSAYGFNPAQIARDLDL